MEAPASHLGGHGALAALLEAQGLREDWFRRPHEIPAVLERLERLGTLTSKGLLDEYAQRGLPAFEGMSRSELLPLARSAVLWEEFNTAGLQQACWQRSVEAAGEPRQALEELLRALAWEDLGVPVTRLPCVEAAKDVLSELQALLDASSEELASRCAAQGLPCAGSPEAARGLLRQALLWSELPHRELARECAAHQLPDGPGAGAGPPPRSELLERLLACARGGGRVRARGIPEELLGGPEAAEAVLRDVDHWQCMCARHLEAELRRRGLPVGSSCGDSQALVDRLRDVAVWEKLPLRQLCQQCEEAGVPPPRGATLEERAPCIRGLLERRDLLERCRLHGVPASRLRGAEEAAALCAQYEEIEQMSLGHLTQWYARDLGLPPEQGMTREELAGLRRRHALWLALPLPELRQECLRGGGAAAVGADEEAKREGLLGVLAGYLQREGGDRRAVLGAVRQWRGAPLASLEAEVDRVEAALQPGGPEGDGRLRAGQVEALLERDRAEAWQAAGFEAAHMSFAAARELVGTFEQLRRSTDAEVAEEFEGLLSHHPSVLELSREGGGRGRDWLLGVIRRVLVWDALPVAKLEELALRGSPSIVPAPDAADAEERKISLVDQLIVDLLRDAYEARGVPVGDLGTLEASRVVDVVHDIGAQDDEELRAMYQELGFPEEEHLERGFLVQLLRDVAIWQSLPIEHLQRRVRQLPWGAPERALLSPPEASSAGEELGEPSDLAGLRDAGVRALAEHAVMERWQRRGFEAERVRDFSAVADSVQRRERWGRLSEEELRREFLACNLPESEARGREHMLQSLEKLLVWEMLPLPELERHCAGLRPPIVPSSGRSGESLRRSELIHQLIVHTFTHVFEQRGIPVKRIGTLKAAIMDSQLRAYQAMKPDELRAQCETMGISSPQNATKDELLAQLEEACLWCMLPARDLWAECVARGLANDAKEPMVSVFLAQVQRAFDQQRAALSPSSGEPGAEAGMRQPTLDDGACFYINLERREDRRHRMESLARPHRWLSSCLERVVAVDGQELEWQQLVADALFTREAWGNSERGGATIGATPDECSTHLTLGGCGCALSHRKAWEALVRSERSWALVMEDDLTGLCADFDGQLDRLLALLPASWGFCYLGHHTGELLPAGGCLVDAPPRLPRGCWLPGLWGYVVTRAYAQRLLAEVFPLREQIDTAAGALVSSWPDSFYLPSGKFLMYSPPTEESRDTDVQTF